MNSGNNGSPAAPNKVKTMKKIIICLILMAFLIMPVGLKTNETISKNNTAQLADIVYTDSFNVN